MLPWLQDQHREEPASVGYLKDCSKCQRDQSLQMRQTLGCAYESSVTPSFPWRHAGDDGPKLSVCPGYSTKLPEVIEAAAAYQHWEKGTLDHRFRGYELTERLMDALEILGANVGAVQSWALRKRSEK